MKQILGYYKEVGVGREYGALTAYMKGKVPDITDANFVVYLIGNIAYIATLNDGEEILIACASNFSFKTDSEYNI